MTGSLSFKTVHSSVRPPRVAVLVDKSDEDWQHTCLRTIEFFSRLWGGAYNLIVPTDGKTIDERFWAILEAFDPDHVYVYRKSGEDFRLSRPDQYRKTLDAHVHSWVAQFGQGGQGDADRNRGEIDKQLRGSWASDFTISPQLQNEIKIRLAPFWLEQWIVEPGAIGAGSGIPFPLTDVTKILLNTEHPDRFATIKVLAESVPELWFGAVCGSFNEKTAEALEGLPISRDLFDFEERDLGRLVEFVVSGAIREPDVFRSDKRNFYELNGIAPFQLSMLQLGLYRPTNYPYWAEPLVLVAGRTLEDFCLYYCLSRLRDRVVWVPPSITEKALSHRAEPASSLESSFVAQLHLKESSNQSQGGLACTSYSLTDGEVEGVVERLASPLGRFRSPIRRADEVAHLVRSPLVAVERDNFQRDVAVQFSDDVSISPFNTPKPKNFHTIHPYEHRYITQLSVARESPPKHFHLGSWIISDARLTTKQVRIGKEGPAYFCPNVAYFGGDIDTVLVRPHLRLPPLHRILEDIAQTQGYECRPSDKGIYADETIRKWGGLAEVARFLRDDAKRALFDRFLDRSESKEGKGVYLGDDRRRYLDFPAIAAEVSQKAAGGLIDKLVSSQVFYRGFIFRCSYCRNSTWFSIFEVTQEFTCKRCGRSQVYTRANWKMPDEPAWFYKLDELVYQGYRQNMAVPLLALDCLRSSTSLNFAFTTDREFWKSDGSKPDAEVDFLAVCDGVLTIGEAKKEDRLGRSVSEENAEIAKYRRIATGIAARSLVLATFASGWSSGTRERVRAGFRDMPHVNVTLLSKRELLGSDG